jgi:pimeloyl-ACP methyl ester carboxylesterase
MLALMDALGLEQVGVVGHDVGGALMQPMARTAPRRMAGLFFFNFVYPGIGPRMAEPDRLNNIWYQSFYQLEMTPALVGATRESCRTYIGYFLKALAHRKDAFDDVLETFTDNFLKPGNLAGGFAHHRASHEGRIRMIKGEAPKLAPIDVPTCIRWAEHDPLFPYDWTDRLGETFSDLDLARFPAGTLPASREPRSRRSRDRSVFHAHRLQLFGSRLKKGWDRQTRQKPAVPCRIIEIVAGKCGFADQPERRYDGSDPHTRGNAIPVLT